MPFEKKNFYPLNEGQLVTTEFWNSFVNEVEKLDNNKLDNKGGSIKGSLKLNKDLKVNDGSNIKGKMNVMNDVGLKGKLSVNGDLTALQNLHIGGDLRINGDLIVDGSVIRFNEKSLVPVYCVYHENYKDHLYSHDREKIDQAIE